VQAHGGRIELTPLPKGTCFQVYLPVEAAVDAGRMAANRRDHDGDDD
jgi:nitrogen-specific signal transduction histidine kinase